VVEEKIQDRYRNYSVKLGGAVRDFQIEQLNNNTDVLTKRVMERGGKRPRRLMIDGLQMLGGPGWEGKKNRDKC